MAAAADTPSRLLVVGASHRSSGLSLRGRLRIEDAALPAFLAALKAAGFREAMVLTAADRFEAIAESGRPGAAEEVARLLGAAAGLAPGELAGQLYTLADEEAARHVFAAVAGLDGMIVGDPEVATRLEACRRIAARQGMLGGLVRALAEAALEAARRIGLDTGLSARPGSIAAAAVRVARDLHGDLAGAGALLLGPGEMGERLAERLRAAGLGRLVVSGRSATWIDQAARRLGGAAVPLDRLPEALAGAEIVIAAQGGSPPLIDRDSVRAALVRRKRRPIFLIDAAIPGDIDPQADSEDGAFYYDLDDLERVVMEGSAERAAAGRVAAQLVAAEAAAFWQDAARARDPWPVALRRRFEAARAAALADAPDADAATATRALVERLLSEVAGLLREVGAGDEPRGVDENAGGAAANGEKRP